MQKLKRKWKRFFNWLLLAVPGVGFTVWATMLLSRWVGDLAAIFDMEGYFLEGWGWFSRTLTVLLFVALSLSVVLNPFVTYRWLWRRVRPVLRWLKKKPETKEKEETENKREKETLATSEVVRPAETVVPALLSENPPVTTSPALPSENPLAPTPLAPKTGPKPAAYSRRLFLMQSGFVTTFAVNSFYVEPLMPEIKRFKVKIRNLPPAFENFTIAHVTDIHVHAYATPEVVAAFVNHVNALKPDLTVVTGDFVTRGNHFFEMAAQTLGKLSEGARWGAYGVSGNHDHWADWRELSKMQPLLNKYGLPLLRDTSTELWLNGDTLWLVGVDDSYTQNDDLPRALRAMGLPSVEQAKRDERPKILLTHTPEFAPKAAPAGFELMLCGHTHGGQFYVPGLTETALSNFPYLRGLYSLDDMQLYVNSGHGTVGPPMRFMTRPEIALITLVPETALV